MPWANYLPYLALGFPAVEFVLVYIWGPILQARLQQYVNHELPDVQAGFRKGKETRDQIVNIHWIIKKARIPEKHLLY